MSAEAVGDYDVVILGGGRAGMPAPSRRRNWASGGPRREGQAGGTCLHRGCIPTKALLHAAEVADTARDGAQFGVKSTFESIDMAGSTRTRIGSSAGSTRDSRGWSSPAASTTSRAVGARRAAHCRRRRSPPDGRNVVLATGSYARSLPGLEIGGRIMTSDEALSIDHVPARVIVLEAVSSVSSSLRVPQFRGRGHDRRGATPAGAGRGRGPSASSSKGLPQAQDRVQDRRAVRRRTQSGDVVRVSLESGESIEADLLLVAVGRGR
jgi:dihydrolipoamide dehydrogenase